MDSLHMPLQSIFSGVFFAFFAHRASKNSSRLFWYARNWINEFSFKFPFWIGFRVNSLFKLSIFFSKITHALLMCILGKRWEFILSVVQVSMLSMPVLIPRDSRILVSWGLRDSCWGGTWWWRGPRPPPTPAAPGWRSGDWSSPGPGPCLAGSGRGGRGNIFY